MESAKVKLISLGKFIENFVTNAQKTGKEKRTIQFLEARIELLYGYWSKYTELYDQLIETMTSTTQDPEPSEKLYIEIEMSYSEALAWLNEQLDTLKPKTNISSENQSQTTRNDSAVGANPLHYSQQVKLPKITLPKFNGSYNDWTAFRDTFTSLVHSQSNLDDISKLTYLTSSLTGEAANLIKHLSISQVNYEAAWTILTNRYNNTRILVNANISSIVNLPSMKNETESELRRVLDNATQMVRGLENLGRSVNTWDDWLVFFLSSKLDTNTRKDWETSLSSSTSVPSFQQLTTFLEGRLHALNAIEPRNNPPEKKATSAKNSVLRKSFSRSHHSSNSSSQSCLICQETHLLMFCPQFRNMNVDRRKALVKEKKLCYNCLKPNHSTNSCLSTNRCKQCKQKHHTMLHQMNTSSSANSTTTTNTASLNPSQVETTATTTTSAHISNTRSTHLNVLLATAVIFVRSANGRLIKARALIDQGSESNFISSSLANILRLPKRKVNVEVTGVGNSDAGIVKSVVNHDIISSADSNISYNINSLVLPTLTGLLPSQPVANIDIPHIQGLKLADPQFNKPANIDLILGTSVYARILLDETRRGHTGTPIAQLTTLGWILFGGIENSAKESVTSFHISLHTVDLDTLLRRFWEIEEYSKTPLPTPDEIQCEESFKASCRRNATGRYIVQLPIKSETGSLGVSRDAALSTLLSMERRFLNNSILRQECTAFMNEYLNLNHMALVNNENDNSDRSYYLPHHAVMKASSTTTRLRVVFNASQKSSTGISLNDILHTGPKMQNDVFDVILRWRVYPFVLSGDIEKMYRQILVDEKDTDLQRILWRESTNHPVRCYKLLTVTYGTACAPYLACRTLKQLAKDYEHVYPIATESLRNNFYVDDALFGSFDQESAINLRDDLGTLLRLGGFRIRKWLANHPDLLNGLAEDKEGNNISKFVGDAAVKTLGMSWCPLKDTFSFNIKLSQCNSPTKRSILSDISKLYDPLGWLSPLKIRAKSFMQQLWLLNIDWDDTLPSHIQASWLSFKNDLKLLPTIQMERWIGVTNAQLGLELHGFSDASLIAYGAVVYLRVIHDYETIQISLLAAKTRVSPLKTISLPRLELCGATLLAELVRSLQETLKLKDVPLYMWCDSTIVLAWLREHPAKWKTFVANRTARIHELVPRAIWRHVCSNENPADCASRGMSVQQLKEFRLWWSGPDWLSQNSSQWPCSPPSDCDNTITQELRPTSGLVVQLHEKDLELLARYSDLNKLLRITAYCYRFYHNIKRTSISHQSGFLTTVETAAALAQWIKLVQNITFSTEIKALRNKREISSTSNIIALKPFLDEGEILRVGGRLKHSLLSFDEKYPIILPHSSYLTQLIIEQAHRSTAHGSTQLTLQTLRTKYWIIKGRSKVKQIIHKCIICFRHRAKSETQIMSDLPGERLRPCKPFTHSGVDYAGPFNVTPICSRGQKSVLSYVAVFVCLVTRAIHLELVMSLSAQAFVAALKRFINRRGKCSTLYSDNATCFTAANKQLTQHLKDLIKETALRNTLLNDGIEWKFIPPAAPHFGGIWEAGVKSMKHHLVRIVGSHTLTIEEMTTLLTQIEACLNSRPLSSLTDDPTDMSALTPSHFLIGESTINVPTPSIINTSISQLRRWDLVQHLHEQLWQRWHAEYIQQLQSRNKWRKPKPSIRVNDLVLLKDEKCPPANWLLGRVIEVFPGSDGHVRVVSVRHKDGIYKRAITKCCVLPINTEEPKSN